MRSNFEIALAHVMREEGGLSDDPHDPGGLTKHGITLPVLTSARGRDVGRADLQALTRAEAAEIYRERYWNVIGADTLPAGLDLFLFDFAVNSGPGRAVRTLQKMLGVTIDGLCGPLTQAALQNHETRPLIEQLHRARLDFLRSLSVWRFFGKGWSGRNDRTRAAALALLSQSAPASPSLRERTSTMTIALQDTKTILQSRTVWANVIGLASLGLSLFGYGGLDVGGLTDAVLQTVTAGSFVASTLFRIKATTRLT